MEHPNTNMWVGQYSWERAKVIGQDYHATTVLCKSVGTVEGLGFKLPILRSPQGCLQSYGQPTLFGSVCSARRGLLVEIDIHVLGGGGGGGGGGGLGTVGQLTIRNLSTSRLNDNSHEYNY